MKKFEKELANLRQAVVAMGEVTESMVAAATDAISSPHNQSLLEQVLSQEKRLDHMQLEIDREAIRLLTVYSPVAGDLRFILSIFRITAELERIGDHATNMCENVQLMASKTDAEPLAAIPKMGGIVRGMVSSALDAFLHSDSSSAEAVVAKDDAVDALNDQILEALLGEPAPGEFDVGSRDIAIATAQVLIARSLERIADQSTNISEEVVYMVKGDDIRHRDL